MYPENEVKTKNRIKGFMRDKHSAILPEVITKYIYRHMTISDAELILDEMVETDDRILKSKLEDGSYVYYYKYIKKKRYY